MTYTELYAEIRALLDDLEPDGLIRREDIMDLYVEKSGTKVQSYRNRFTGPLARQIRFAITMALKDTGFVRANSESSYTPIYQKQGAEAQ